MYILRLNEREEKTLRTKKKRRAWVNFQKSKPLPPPNRHTRQTVRSQRFVSKIFKNTSSSFDDRHVRWNVSDFFRGQKYTEPDGGNIWVLDLDLCPIPNATNGALFRMLSYKNT